MYMHTYIFVTGFEKICLPRPITNLAMLILNATVKDGFNFHANCMCTEVMYAKRARKERNYRDFNNFGNSEEDVAEFLKVHK